MSESQPSASSMRSMSAALETGGLNDAAARRTRAECADLAGLAGRAAARRPRPLAAPAGISFGASIHDRIRAGGISLIRGGKKGIRERSSLRGRERELNGLRCAVPLLFADPDELQPEHTHGLRHQNQPETSNRCER